MLARTRQYLSQSAKRWGLQPAYWRLYVESRLIGERLEFLFARRPLPEHAILVVGSGRSGTTWVAGVLCELLSRVQLIFEPLHPSFNDEMRRLSNESNPFYLRPQCDDREWESLWRRTLTGRVRSRLTESERTSFFPKKYLVKAIRANLMLGFVCARFHPSILYIIRHPCAVVESRLRVGWHASVDDLLRQKSLVDDHLTGWVDDIRRERDLLGAHAVCWAVENKVALEQLAGYPYHFVSYEVLSLEPEWEFQRILRWLGHSSDVLEKNLTSRPSRMTDPERFVADPLERLSAWKGHLSQEEQRRILDWADKLGITAYDDGILPVDARE